MALDQTTVLQTIRDKIAAVTGVSSVYDAGDVNTESIPMALADLPAVLVYPGADITYDLVNGIHTHTYDVSVQVFESGMDAGERIIEAFVATVKLGGAVASVVYCLYRRSSGFATLEYGGREYIGYEITLEVMEQAQVVPVA